MGVESLIEKVWNDICTCSNNAIFTLSNMIGNRFRILIFLLTVSMMWSCSPVKHLGKDAVLLNKNIIKSDKKSLVDGAASIVKQKPNRKILGIFRFHLGMYTIANQGKETKFKRWVKKAIGEEPVLLNSSLTLRSTEQLQQYLENNGYFNGHVSDTVVFIGKQKANVIYKLDAGIPYTIKNFTLLSNDTAVYRIVAADTVNSAVKYGNNYSTTAFQVERDRVTGLLRNHGYFDINQQYIRFLVDSSLQSHQVNVIMKIEDANDQDSLVAHKVYQLRDVFIQTDYNPLEETLSTPTDTVIFNELNFLYSTKEILYKPDALSRRIYLEKYGLYSAADADYTYRGLSKLGVFRFVNLRYEPVISDSADRGWLNSYVMLTPASRQEYRAELEGTHNGGNFGIGGNLIYTHKNIFHGAELLEIKLRAKVESVPNFTDTVADTKESLSLNTQEFGPEINLRIPGTLWPLHKLNKVKEAAPSTNFKSLYNYQLRPEYKQNIALVSAGFEFTSSPKFKHLIYPAEINLSKFDLTDAFVNKLITSGDPELLRYYESYLITNGRYSLIYNEQLLGIYRDFIFIRFNFEIAGNSLRLIDALTKSDYNKNDANYEIFNVKYSQYVRPDFDARYYQVFNQHSSLVYRLTSGLGYTYLNSQFIPYNKAFFAGGANDLRAFRTGTVGPGSYQDNSNIEQFGDVKINLNFEYRFDIFKILEGAFFTDMGNVWLLEEISERPGGKFQLSKVPSELAVGSGMGFRFDFSFFIFRVDAAYPVRDPSREENDRWTLPDLKPSDAVFNFGIGYPF